MIGLERKVSELAGENGKLFLVAYDHPQMYGVMNGLVDPIKEIYKTAKSPIDGFILNPGIIQRIDSKKVKGKKIIMRSSLGGTMIGSEFSDFHETMCSPKLAINLGVDAILVMLVLGGAHDKESMLGLAKTVEQFHEYSIPVIVEPLAADFKKNNDSDFVRNGARIAAELGADFVKSFYCDDFISVIEGCPVPVLLAGGPKDKDIAEITKLAITSGAFGLALGRNIFQSKDPLATILRINETLGRKN